MARRKAKQALSVVVGEPWPDGVEVEAEKSAASVDGDVKTEIATRLALGAAFLVLGLAAWAILRDDRALVDRIFNLAEWIILFALSWIAGHHKHEK